MRTAIRIGLTASLAICGGFAAVLFEANAQSNYRQVSYSSGANAGGYAGDAWMERASQSFGGGSF